MIAIGVVWFFAGLVFGTLLGIFLVSVYAWETMGRDIQASYDADLAEFQATLNEKIGKFERGIVLLDKAYNTMEEED